MNRSKVMQQWLATPDNKTTDIRYPLAIDSGIERITGNSTPPSKMSDTASDIRNLLVYVWRDFLVMTRRKMVTLVSTIDTDKIAINVSTTEFSAIVLTSAVTHDLISWWFLPIVDLDFFSMTPSGVYNVRKTIISTFAIARTIILSPHYFSANIMRNCLRRTIVFRVIHLRYIHWFLLVYRSPRLQS